MKQPGRLVASGRGSDIFEHGPGFVLRRSRQGRSMAIEAQTMDYLRARGYPIPAAAEVSSDGTEMVVERINGRSMLADLSRRPWTLNRHCTVLADLHRRLHDIPASPWLIAAPGTCGNKVVHLDLHPLNVIMSPDGPVVIDWTNAA